MTATTAPSGVAAADTAGAAATTIASRVRDRARDTPNRVAMREKTRGIWAETTWAAYWDTVLTVAHGLLALGVGPGERVAVLAEGRVLADGAPEELARALEGRVWRGPAIPGALSSKVEGGRRVARVLADARPGPGFERAEATLEDAYFAALKGAA